MPSLTTAPATSVFKRERIINRIPVPRSGLCWRIKARMVRPVPPARRDPKDLRARKIGRASWRERVEISVVAGSLKKKKGGRGGRWGEREGGKENPRART